MKNPFPTIAGILILLVMSCDPMNTERASENVSHLFMKSVAEDPEVIRIEEPRLFPEGIEYDSRGDRFLLTSMTRGTIGQVQNGQYTEWIDDQDLIATVGIHIDHTGNRILVANSDPGVSERSSEETKNSLAALVAYDLTGNRIFYAELGQLHSGAHFANDVTVDEKGNAYVTDSFSGVIYKVDPAGNASIFYSNEEMDAVEDGFGLNGIDYDPRGYLLVSWLDANKILRFPIDDPQKYTEVKIPVELFSPDGIYLKNPNELLVVSNDSGGDNGKIQTFSTWNKWETTTLIDEFDSPGAFPTTVTVKRNTPYVLHSHLDMLFSGEHQEEFSIVRAK